MYRDLWSVGIGLTFIVCGLNGELVLMGTNSGDALAVVGVILLGWGLFGVVSVIRAEVGESTRSRRTMMRRTGGTRTPPWMSTRRRR